MFNIEKRTNNDCWKWLVFLLSGIVPFFLLPGGGAAWADELVHGEYLSSSGKAIHLRITIGAPPPAHVIVAQMIPSGSGIVHSSPKAQKINIKTGEIKWLLKKVEPGVRILKVKLTKPVQSSTIRTILRYRHPISGRYVESLVTN